MSLTKGGDAVQIELTTTAGLDKRYQQYRPGEGLKSWKAETGLWSVYSLELSWW